MTQKTRSARSDALPYEVLSSVEKLGQRIRTARLRRRLEQEELAKACGVARRTIWRIEKGEPGVALGTVFAVLWKLGLLSSTAAVADPEKDDHGKTLEAARLPQRARQSSADVLDNNF